MIKKLQILLISLAVTLLFIGFTVTSTDALVYALLIIFGHNVVYALGSIKQHIVFLLYNISFFVFLIGRMFIAYFFDYNPKGLLLGLDFYDNQVVNNIILILTLSLLSYYIGYRFARIPKIVTFNRFSLYKFFNSITNQKEYLYKLTLILLLITFSFRVWSFVDIYFFVKDFGYSAYYVDYTSSVPSIALFIGRLFEVTFFVHLSLVGLKKASLLPISLYLLEGGFSLLTGQRNIFALNVLIIIIFVAVHINKELLSKIPKKVLVFIGVFVVSLPFIFIVVGNLRWGNEGSLSIIQSLKRLIFDQGVTANLLGYTQTLAEQLPDGRYYSLGAFMRLFKKIASIFIDVHVYSGQTVDHALYGHSFTYAITYLIMPLRFMAGNGYGSSFLAELFYDFGFIGTIIGSLFYGYLTYVLVYLLKFSYIIKAFSFLTIRYFLFTPRAGVFDFLTYVFSPLNILFIVLLIAISYLINIRNEIKEGSL